MKSWRVERAISTGKRAKETYGLLIRAEQDTASENILSPTRRHDAPERGGQSAEEAHDRERLGGHRRVKIHLRGIQSVRGKIGLLKKGRDELPAKTIICDLST